MVLFDSGNREEEGICRIQTPHQYQRQTRAHSSLNASPDATALPRSLSELGRAAGRGHEEGCSVAGEMPGAERVTGHREVGQGRR